MSWASGQGVFGESDRSAFDSIAHTQGRLTGLMDYLWARYEAHLADRVAERLESGQTSPSAAEALRVAPARDFCAFCSEFLAENYVVEHFPLDSNLGLRLANNDMVALGPNVEEVQGTMQPSESVAVTEGRGRTGARPG